MAVAMTRAIVSHRWIFMIASKPRIPAATITQATTTNAITFVASPDAQPRRSKTVAVASVESVTRTVSQPTRSRYDTRPGRPLPTRPNAARLSTSVGAEPRLPAIETSPTRKKLTTTPTTVATSACVRPMPKPSTNAPYDTARTEMLEAHHGQNSPAELPLRSLSAMTLMPLVSMALMAPRLTGAVCGSGRGSACGSVSVLMSSNPPRRVAPGAARPS